MRALVTGSAGFLGRHFAAELTARGYEVLEMDVTDAHPDGALEIFRYGSHVFDLVVHCAAVEPHRAAIDGQPMHLVQNLQLDAGMFEWAVRTGQKRVLYISSSAAYPVRGFQDSTRLCDRMLREDYIGRGLSSVPPSIDPDAGYGWLKLTGERMAADAQRAGLPVHIVRPFSGYGEDQGEDWPFGAFMARARCREDPFTIWGDGTQVRDWLHVDDLVKGALKIVDDDERRPVNLCTGIGTSMLELVEMFCAAAGYEPELELLKDKPAGVAHRVGDPARMLEHYKPDVSLAEGLRRAL